MKVEIELPEIEGFEYTGEFRPPKKDEYYLWGNGKLQAHKNHLIEEPFKFILKKKPNPQDWIGKLCLFDNSFVGRLHEYDKGDTDNLPFSVWLNHSEENEWFEHCRPLTKEEALELIYDGGEG